MQFCVVWHTGPGRASRVPSGLQMLLDERGERPQAPEAAYRLVNPATREVELLLMDTDVCAQCRATLREHGGASAGVNSDSVEAS